MVVCWCMLDMYRIFLDYKYTCIYIMKASIQSESMISIMFVRLFLIIQN